MGLFTRWFNPGTPFEVGDICTIRTLPVVRNELRGLECTIVTSLFFLNESRGDKEWVHRVEIASKSGTFVGPPEVLKKLPPPNEATSWENSVWKPNALKKETEDEDSRRRETS